MNVGVDDQVFFQLSVKCSLIALLWITGFGFQPGTYLFANQSHCRFNPQHNLYTNVFGSQIKMFVNSLYQKNISPVFFLVEEAPFTCLAPKH